MSRDDWVCLKMTTDDYLWLGMTRMTRDDKG